MPGIKDGVIIENSEILNIKKIGNTKEDKLPFEEHTRAESRN